MVSLRCPRLCTVPHLGKQQSKHLLMNQGRNTEGRTQMASVVAKLLTTGCHSLSETSCPVLSFLTVDLVPERGLDASHYVKH